MTEFPDPRVYGEVDSGLLAEALLLVDRPTALVNGTYGDTGRIVWTNGAFTELAGRGGDALHGQVLGSVLRPAPGDHGPTWLSSQRSRSRAMQLERGDGSRLDVWVVAQPLTPRGGRVPWAVSISPYDDVARAEQDLQVVQDRFTALARHAPVGILYSSVGLRAAFVNDAFADLWGRPADALMGTAWLSGVDTRDLKVLVETAKMTLSGSQGREIEIRVGPGGSRIAHLRMAALVEPGLPTAMVAIVEEVTERQRLQQQLIRQAAQDSLTGLANRAHLVTRLAELEALEVEEPVALAFIDLDDFKTVNDTLGHAGGDRLLTVTAGRLLEAAGPRAVTARLGGDEFAVLATGLDEAEAATWAARLLREVCASVTLDGHAVDPTASVGLACGTSREDLAQLLRNADQAMYDGKRRGRGTVTVFRQEMHDEREAERQLVTDLRSAIAHDELTVNYQPVVRVGPDGTGVQLSGVEALARWHHPVHGNVPPTIFVAAAEAAGLVVALDISVLSAAIAQIPIWDRELGRLAPQWVAVNLSAHHLADPGLVDLVSYLLDQHAVDGHRLCLEVTETVLVEDRGTAAKVLERLRSLGARIAIDDFGTGYSSLAYLADLPVNALKLDRQFTMSLGSARHRAIIKAIVEVAEALGLLVIAEGVEDMEQLRILTGLGCDLIQGWAVARAVTATDLVAVARRLGPATFPDEGVGLPRQRQRGRRGAAVSR